VRLAFNLLLVTGLWAAGSAQADVRTDAHQVLLSRFGSIAHPAVAAQRPGVAGQRLAAAGGVSRGGTRGPHALFDVKSGTAGVTAPGYKLPFELPEALTPSEDPVNKFFRTGILVGDKPSDPAKKLSVGPCEGGQLLNLRSSF
jgi:hypothetical protein